MPRQFIHGINTATYPFLQPESEIKIHQKERKRPFKHLSDRIASYMSDTLKCYFLFVLKFNINNKCHSVISTVSYTAHCYFIFPTVSAGRIDNSSFGDDLAITIKSCTQT